MVKVNGEGVEMKVIVSNVLTVTDYPEFIEEWCKQKLVITNPEYTRKVRMNLWLGNTPKYLYLYEKDSDKLILPFGTLRKLPAPIDIEYVSDLPTAPTINFGGKKIKLYPYQENAVQRVLEYKYGILRSPAGSGKTQMGIELAKRFGTRTLWLTHTLDLLNQSKARAEQYIDNDLIGTITEGKVNVGKGITFATIQTMCKLDLDKYKNTWDTVIVDECHRVAGTPTAVTQFYKVINALAARHKIGLSATVHRADGMIAATHALLGETVYSVPEEEIGDKIVKVGILPVGTNVGVSIECMNSDGTLNYQKMITYLTTHPGRAQVIVHEIMSNEGKSCLILSDRLDHLESLMRLLPSSMQKNAVMVSGKMTSKTGKAEREQAISDMRTGKKKYLFATYKLAKEGLDIPCLERLFLTTPQKDSAVIEQSVGRIARKCEGKAEPITYDFVDKMAYLMKSYKQRCTTYRKIGCYFVE